MLADRIAGRETVVHIYEISATSGLTQETVWFDAPNGARLTLTHSLEKDVDVATSKFTCAPHDRDAPEQYEHQQLLIQDALDGVYSVNYFFSHFASWCDWRAKRLQLLPESAFPHAPEHRYISQVADSWVFRTPDGDWLQLDTLYAPKELSTSTTTSDYDEDTQPLYTDTLHVWSACAMTQQLKWESLGTIAKWPHEMHNGSMTHAITHFYDVIAPACRLIHSP